MAIQRNISIDRIPFLGVLSAPVDSRLAAHLCLPKRVGLVIEYINPKSSAAKVLKTGDIIHKLEDQLAINSAQLQVLVSLHKVGEEIELSIIRNGKKQKVKVKLGSKKLQQNQQNISVNFGNNISIPDLQMDGFGQIVIPENLRRNGALFDSTIMNSMTIVEWDEKLQYKLLQTNDGNRLSISNRENNNIIFEGSVNNAEDLKKVPKKHIPTLNKLINRMPNIGATINNKLHQKIKIDQQMQIQNNNKKIPQKKK